MLLFALSACNTIELVPVEVCGKLRIGAQCAYFPEGPTRKQTEDEYQAGAFPSMRMSVFHWGELKKMILKLCEAYKKCTVAEVEEHFAAFEMNLGEHYEHQP